ncbi:peptide chain release factor H [Massilia sp. CCM 8695]|uniref:Peptide chain release factor H n=1 Tax=Massilia frigida TaxID=2609281 RepID=A0ABX0NFA0_9BURK|nr:MULTISPECIES: peptide chain release factor H [Massilia]MDM5180899.1 peptide chain release factor H [Massilia sp. DJPM01]NHZ80420.1 peptide chain release factor H [Massilia frigida]
MIWLQITANTGPVECCLAVTKALAQLNREARKAGVAVSVVEQLDGPVGGTLRSVLLELDGPAELEGELAARWCGSIQWICESPYRKMHKRKNWFLSGAAFAPPAVSTEFGEIRYEATRASGPGGQHVNKTDSAIRATHVASGLSVKVQTERSQHANKRLAAQLLLSKLGELATAEEGKNKSERRMHHFQAERGNAERVFVGMGFVERTT